MKKTASIITALLIFLNICAYAAPDVSIADCTQNVLSGCIDVTLSVSQPALDVAVLALNKPMSEFKSMKEAQESIISVAQIRAVSPAASVRLFYSGRENAENIYIYASCDGKYIDEKSIPFYSKDEFIVRSFKNESVWNNYPNLVSDYNKTFGMFELSARCADGIKNLTQTEKDGIYKSMFGKRNGFAAVSDIEKAYFDAVDDAIDKNDGNYAGGGSSGGGRKGGSNVGSIPAGGTANTAENKEFTDLDGALWAKEAIESLREKGIINGVAQNLFEPNSGIKREDFVVMIVKAAKFEITQNPCGFSDVLNGAYYEKYINTAKDLKIISGVGNSKFGVGDYLKREDLALILYRAFYNGEKKYSDKKPSDWEDVSDYAKEAVETLLSDGVINGMPDSRFAPFEYTTRAQCAQLIYNLLLAGRI